ncbi:MAG: Ig-like domain repeat protein, partial [Planctomycetes bacterium]|nr:Ig-like domain repeat protein [Planctomycetota bacterium]
LWKKRSSRRQPRPNRPRQFRRTLLLEQLEDRTAPALVTWTGLAGDSNWDTAANWSGNAAPTSSDDVQISNSSVTLDHAATVNSLFLSGGSLSIAQDFSTTTDLTLGGKLTGPGNISVNGLFTWLNGGDLQGPQGSSLTAEGGISIPGSALSLTLDGRTLNNVASAVWQGSPSAASATMATLNGAVINNQAGASFLLQSSSGEQLSFQDQTWNGAEGTFNNAGLLEVQGANAGVGMQVISSGAICLDSGSLGLGDDYPKAGADQTYSGSIWAAPNTSLAFNGYNIDFTSSASVDAAAVAFSGYVTFEGSYSASQQTSLQGGYVTFSGPVTNLGVLKVNQATLTFATPGLDQVKASSVVLSRGVLSSNGNLQLNDSGAYSQDASSALNLELTQNNAAAGDAQITVAGLVSLAGYLHLNLGSQSPLVLAGPITLINNQGTSPVNGTFSGDSEGSLVSVGGYYFFLSYVGGDGNDVVLSQEQITVTGVKVNYDSNPHPASGTALGAESPTPANLTSELHLAYSTDGGKTFSRNSPVNAGTYEVYYTFDGDSNHYSIPTETDSHQAVVIGKVTPTFSAVGTTIITDGTPSLKLSGTISYGSLIPTGSVTVTVDSVIQMVPIAPDGSFSATFATKSLNVGTHSVSFSYGGDQNFTGATTSGSLDDTYAVLVMFDQGHAKHAGSTLPIQIALGTVGGQDVSSSGVTVTALGIAATTDTTDTVGAIDPSAIGTLTPVQAAGGSNPNNVFRFQGGANPFYMYNLKIPQGLAAGTYRLYFSITSDPLDHWVTFTVD